MFAPLAAAGADGCDSGACTLVPSDEDPSDVGYLGFRPFVTDWWGVQNAELVDDDGEVAATYPIGIMDFQLPFVFDAALYDYHYPDFDEDADDPAGLAGTMLYDVGFGPQLGGDDGPTDALGNSVLVDSLTAFDSDGTYYWEVTGPGGFQNTLEVDPSNLFGSSDYVTFSDDQDEPTQLWDTLPHADLAPADVSDMLPPDELISSLP